jgi:DNA replication protein DnaC
MANGTGKTHVATALGIQAIEHHRRKVRFFSTIELVNALEQEKAKGKAGQTAEGLTKLDLRPQGIDPRKRFLGRTFPVFA